MKNSKLFHSFFLFLFYICFASFSSTFSDRAHKCSTTQSHALLMFKQNLMSTNDTYFDSICQHRLGSSYHPIMMNWSESVDCCTWDGVSCNYLTGDVIGLDLDCGKLRGTIHPNTTLFHLPHLERLNLAFNGFDDSQIPQEIGRLSSSLTHLNISQCGFNGQIPSEISLFPNLVSLDLSLNSLDFKLEPDVFNNLLQNSTLLRELLLPDVRISFMLPSYINISSSLRTLDVSNTGLRGKFPDNILSLQYLESLDLSGNDYLIGPLPKINKSINNPLKWLDLSSLKISGKIPDSIGHLKALNYLDLSSSNISGVIPNSIGDLKFLSTLSLFSCLLNGSLPESLVNLRRLSALYLSSNMFTGTLPSWLFALPSLEIIFLNNNKFNGSIPSELFTHRSLKVLSLHDNQLSGKIDLLDETSIQQSFRQLSNLTYLDLSFNSFSGVWELERMLSSLKYLSVLDLSYSGLSVVTNLVTGYVNPDFHVLELASCNITMFPESLRAMKNLNELDLSSNKIDGHVPDWVGEIGGNQLYYLNLSHNFITGFPHFEWDGLVYLYLQSNQIQGSFLSPICNMSHLLYLDLSNNSFNGVIPQCFGNIYTSLMMVDLGKNDFHGTIPNTYENCGHLAGLVLNGNQLEGAVPSSLSNCRSLKLLDLGNNHLHDIFPAWLGDLPNMQVLILRSNNFHGPVETSFANELPFQSLVVLDLSHNEFVGRLPANYFRNFNAMKKMVVRAPELQFLHLGDEIYYSVSFTLKGVQLSYKKFYVGVSVVDLSCNKFEGKIPDIIGSLKSLVGLNLSHNHLNGQIPSALGNIQEIESLDLSWNQLTGEIPQSLVTLSFLVLLNLSQNHLVGCIPVGTQLDSFTESSFGGNAQLSGRPLTEKCEHVSEPQPEANGDTESELAWKLVTLGFGCGTLLGLVMGYLMLSTGRPMRFNSIVDAIEQMVQTRRKKRR